MMILQKNQLPKGWEIKKLGEIGRITYGYTEKASAQEIGPKFLRITDIQDDGVNWKNVPYCKISDSDLKKYKLENGDIVFARTGATTGKSYLLKDPPKSVYASYLIKVQIAKNNIVPEYLYWFFQTSTYWDKINSGVAGAAQGGFNATKLSELAIPLPPLPEQLRIVAILDEAFTAIAKAKENAEKNLKNAREVFEGYLNEIFDHPSKEWVIKKLDEISNIIYGYTEKSSFIEEGPKFLRITDIQNNQVDWSSVPFCKCSNIDLNKYKLKSGDIVFVRTGATTGKSYLLFDPPEAVFASYLIRLQINTGINLLPQFLSYYFQTKSYWNHINAGISGSAQGGFNATKLGELLFAFPRSLDEQRLLISKLDELAIEVQKLEYIYKRKLNNCEEIKKSLLQLAFSGELNTGS
jgi:type I restriction enzyme, S subunit